MGCGVVPGNVYALSGCHCGRYSSSINNRSSIDMIGCFIRRLGMYSEQVTCMHPLCLGGWVVSQTGGALLAYEVIRLSMAKEDGAGRDKANPQQARECTR